MAKCKDCGYPWTTADSCPNCGSDNPVGNNWISNILWIIGIGLGIFIFSYINNNSETVLPDKQQTDSISNVQFLDSISAKINSIPDETTNASSEEEIYPREYYMYQCRQCGTQIKWVGSVYWDCYLNDNGNVTYDILTNFDNSLEGDTRINTESYGDEGHFTSGIFCSVKCAEEHVNRFDYWNH